ncbi:HlyD-family secretion protein [Proteus mirabilis]|uniref:HlyD-family secretion protein n=1 Tax=Proteus mirabilis TaxID=584 RepID=A0A2X2BJX4_PROMI|nr:HlyD-family secretion protein [Proteus mirabilis]
MGELKLLKLIFQPKHLEELTTILVKEGDFVKAGEVLATMDTRTLKEQLHEVQGPTRASQK